MSTEDSRAIAHRIMEQLDRRNLNSVTEHYAPDAQFHGWGPQTLDLAGYTQTMSELLNAFPDSRFSVTDWIAEGDKVVARHRFEGTHRTAYMGLPATGKHVAIGGIVILRFAGGKVLEAWLNADFAGMMQQLGAIPTPS